MDVSRLQASRVLIAPLLIAAGVAACLGDSTGPGRINVNVRTPTISARLDTIAWSDAASVTETGAISTRAGSYSIVADGRIADGRQVRLTISMNNIRGAGTYPIGVGTSVPGASAGLLTSSGAVWTTLLSGAAGSLVLSEVTATRMRGTFTMSLTPQNILAGSVPLNVTGGQFDLPVSGAGAGAVLPENAGSRIAAILDGEPFNAAQISGGHIGEDGLSIQGTSLARGIEIFLEGITGPGTYALTEATPRRSIGVIATSPAREWTSRRTGGSGSVTITSMTASRTIGTFTATLVPEPGTTGSLSVTSGVFDIGRQPAAADSPP